MLKLTQINVSKTKTMRVFIFAFFVGSRVSVGVSGGRLESRKDLNLTKAVCPFYRNAVKNAEDLIYRKKQCALSLLPLFSSSY